MVQTIPVLRADGTEGTITIKSSAATRILYRQVFREDLYKAMQKLNADGAGDDADGAADLVSRLCYIMYMSGKGEGCRASMDGYMAWLEEIDEMSLMESGGAVVSTYASQTAPESVPKNPPAQLSAP